MPTHRIRILDFVRRFPGRDDDQISSALRISPRQTVNIICRDLEANGLVTRRRGANGKILNSPTEDQRRLDRGAIGLHVEIDTDDPLPVNPDRPRLSAQQLLQAGFTDVGPWELETSGKLKPHNRAPTTRGVYSFVQDGFAQYVGVASTGLKKRLRFYARPGASQRTNQRLNLLIRAEISKGAQIAIYVVSPPDFNWNGLMINGSAGLEVGLIQSFQLPWNARGSGT
jgi:DNA-binding MarR family transcriptional regulator